MTVSVDALLDRVPRPLRFAAVGGSCALVQLALLSLFVQGRVEVYLANTLAFLLSTQVNFVLSSLITWRDRTQPTDHRATVARRLLGYNVTALGSLVINQLAFALALRMLPYLLAAVVGILAGMLLTYLVSGWLLFRPRLLAQHAESFTNPSSHPA